ncbi:MAG: outer membrane beta-barrel protein [bacterium]
MRLFPAIAAAAICVTGTSALALDFAVTLNQESEYTTNSGLTEEDEVSEWIHSPGVGLEASHEGPNLNLDVDYSVNRRLFQQDLFDDETESAGRANLVWNALPERLDFTVNHTRTQTAIRSIGGPTPDNRQETTETSAGPTLRFNPRGQDQILLSYLYGDRSADITDTDATTHDTSLSYVLATSPTNSVAFTLMQNQVQYDNPFVPDIEYQIAQVTLVRELSNLDYSLSGGFNRAERSQNRDDVDGVIFELQADWQARASTAVSLTIQRDIQDQSTALGAGTFVDDLDFSADSDLAEVFTNHQFSVSVEQRLNESTSFTVGADYLEEDYEDIGRDTTRQALRAALNRNLTPQLRGSIGFSLENQDFDDEGEEADTLRGDLRLDYDVGRNLTTAFTVRYEERDSDAAIATGNYEAWSAIITLSYTLLGGASR